MKKYVTRVPGSEHHIYKIGLDTYDILKSGLDINQIKELLNDFLDMGGNVIDTARFDIGDRGTNVEEDQKLVGEWIKESSRRKNMYLVSKSNCLLSSDNKESALLEDLDKSLHNLNTSYVDLFLIDGDDESTEVSFVIDELESLKKQGKILSYGCSNWKAYRIRQAMEYACNNNLEGFTVNQMMWNIASNNINDGKINNSYVKMDEEMMEIHREFNILAMPYSSLSNGFFFNLYLNETEPGTVDMDALKENSPYYNNENLYLYEKMKDIGQKYIASPGWVSLGYLFNQKINTCSLVSVKSLGQLREAFEAVDRGYTFEDFSDIDCFSINENKEEITV